LIDPGATGVFFENRGYHDSELDRSHENMGLGSYLK
jgi:hypothetical protein